MDDGGAAPTGCYKCGRPGHWSRDCPSNPNDDHPKTLSSSYSSFKTSGASTSNLAPQQKSTEKPKKVPQKRPKLTPELLLSDDGLGFVLRHFPRAFKYRGRGHEFVHKVEQAGGSKRVKQCIRELRERVANGGDPTKLHEPSAPHDISNPEQAAAELINLEEPSLFREDASLQNHDTENFQDDMLQVIYEKATEEPSEASSHETVAAATSVQKQVSNQTADTNIQISAELRARIEANRLKALERAATRAQSSQTGAT